MRRLLEKIVGGRKAVAKLGHHQRGMLRKMALHLYESGQKVEHIAEHVAERTPQGFVYAITNPAFDGYVKIGCAIDACSRLAAFQTACPFRAFRLEAAVFTSNRYIAEAFVHSYFSDRRVSGEWFKVDLEEVKALLEDIREFDPRRFEAAA